MVSDVGKGEGWWGEKWLDFGWILEIELIVFGNWMCVWKKGVFYDFNSFGLSS